MSVVTRSPAVTKEDILRGSLRATEPWQWRLMLLGYEVSSLPSSGSLLTLKMLLLMIRRLENLRRLLSGVLPLGYVLTVSETRGDKEAAAPDLPPKIGINQCWDCSSANLNNPGRPGLLHDGVAFMQHKIHD
jgi:hypothetical protein